MSKILIVEDEAAIRDLIKIGLQSKGYICQTAQDGEIASNYIEENQYDLILLDIMIPKIDGYELLKYIKQVEKTPTIFITAKSQTKDKVVGLNEGADDYITKPFEIEELIARIEAVLRRYNKGSNIQEIGNKNFALYRETIFEKVWGEELEFETRTLDLHIQRLRKKLDWKDKIKTVYKIGYMLEVEK